MNETTRGMARLSPERQALLARLQAEARGGATPDAHGAGAPLSAGQRRLWHLHHAQPDQPVCHCGTSIRLIGPLDAAALTVALDHVVGRHDVLRSRFQVIDGEPRQIVSDRTSIEWERVELPPQHATRGEAERALALEFVSRPFDLANDSLLRAQLIRVAAAEHLLVLCLHHLVSDGWSLGILFREISEIYAAHLAGHPPRLDPLPFQYADVARREAARAQTHDARDMAWWTSHLRGASWRIDLAVDAVPRSGSAGFAAAACALQLPRTLSDALRDFARSQGATPFAMLAAALAVLLHRYSGQDDIVIGTTVASRDAAGLDRLIGFFVNTMALRASFSGDPSFRQLLRQMRDAIAGALSHRHVSFEQVVAAVQPERDPFDSRLLQAGLMYLSAPAGELRLPGLTARIERVDAGAAEFSLRFMLEDSAQGIGGRLDYSTDLFAAATAERAVTHFGTLLGSAIAEPDRPVSALTMIAAEARRCLVTVASDTPSADAETPLHDLVHRQAERTPDQPALVQAGRDRRVVTYRSLVDMVASIERGLQQAGVNRGDLVALETPPGPETIAAMLAVLGRGAAFLPLDLSQPAARRAEMIADARPAAVLTPADVEAFVRHPASSPPTRSRSSPADLAYVIYTSGSTGRPKGVMIPHGAIVNRLLWMRDRFPLTTADAVLQRTSLGFDASLWEIFLPLITGARVVSIPQEQRLDWSFIVETIQAERVTVMQLVPSLLADLLRTHTLEGCTSLHHVYCGGEHLSSELVRRFDATSAAHMVNLYGPTENAIDATFWPCRRGDAAAAHVPIGIPLTGVSVYLLDRHLEPVPPGITGELFIGGRSLARGYAGRAALTAERFLPDPFAGGGARMYRTGDRCRQLPGGEIEYRGRADRQLKIQGVRIEPDEVAAVIKLHPHVSDAVVGPHAPEGRVALCAYVVAATEAVLRPPEIRAFVRRRLPSAMVPSTVVAIDALPRLANGKVDLASLPAPPDVEETRDDDDDALSPLAELLLSVWREVLERPAAGPRDDFFALGGDSLSATRLRHRVQELLGREIPLRMIFEHPTVDELTCAIDTAAGRDVGLSRVDRSGPLPLAGPQTRMWLMDAAGAGAAVVNCVMIRATGAFDPRRMERALTTLVSRHEILRTAYAATAEGPVQHVRASREVAIPAIDLRHLGNAAEAEAHRLAREHAAEPVDLRAGRVLRPLAMRVADDVTLLALAIHHIATDAASIAILTRELTALYDAPDRDDLPALALQYGDYAACQDAARQAQAFEPSLAYWSTRLTGLRPATFPPTRTTARASAAGTADARLPAAGETIRRIVSPELTAALRAFSVRHAATPFVTLLGAFAALLRRYAPESDVAVGTSMSDRPAGTESLIGCFLQQVVLKIAPVGSSFDALLPEVRRTLLDAHQHRSAPLDDVVRRVGAAGAARGGGLFRVMFDYHRGGPRTTAVADIAWETFELDMGIARFDVTLRIEDLGREMVAALEYDTALYHPWAARAILDGYVDTLDAVVRSPSTAIATLPPPRPEPPAEPPALAAGLLHAPFERLAAEQPEAIAIEIAATASGAAAITYGELKARADRITRALRSLGVGADDRVGVHGHRSVELIAAVLGVLRAGAAYVPLDPANPHARLATIARDAGLSAIVCAPDADLSFADGVPRVSSASAPAPRDRIDAADGTDSSTDVDDVEIGDCPAHPDSLAYVLYTSGSTGAPKGVMVSHRAAANYVAWSCRAYDLRAADRTPLVTPLAFDLSITSLFAPLSTGGTLVLADEVGSVPAAMDEPFALLKLTPSHLRMYRRSPERLRARTFVIGGEALFDDDVRPWLEPGHGADGGGEHPHGEAALFNEYGPTEATVGCTVHRVDAASLEVGAVPIGRSLAGARLHVLDPTCEVVPIGATGELFIGGIGVARGYLADPKATAEKFVPDPYGPPGARMYRTGDRVRRLDNGTFAFIDRFDRQVKLRGHRIELQEVEAACRRRHAGVAQAVAAVRADTLLAWVVVGDTARSVVNADTLRVHLRQQLPEVMVPERILFLDALPLDSNGKVHVAALPDVAEGGAAPGATPAVSPDAIADGAPAQGTTLEARLARIWAKVLGREAVATDDNFFAIGGHSMAAAQILFAMQSELGVRLSFPAFFDAATVGGLVRLIDAQSAAGASHDARPVTIEEASL